MSPLFSLNIPVLRESIQSIMFYRAFDVLISESVLCASFSIYDIVGFCSDKKREEQREKKNSVSMILSFCTFILYICCDILIQGP
jgi:capsule polysaccharide export protein KpsC/LpsZ